ncbi:hypothetical protein GCM10017161_42290 [Thalassotalea marina]|uniref:Sortilin N-terminal domain-containing protein n=1 Tax=Thalassotalea marina TaxID=1673741 RepID=A0A919BRH6_9GAMM|nr:hypothetical protein GCM10017161_42290 [Thalassotalea marina]
MPEKPSAPLTPTFVELGLERHKVEKLLSINDQIIALTDQGLYRRDSTWQALTDTRYHVLAMATLSDNHWIASVKQNESAFFIETNDAGATWQLFDDNFGGDYSSNEVARTLVYDSEKQKLYATGLFVLASSTDMGRSWTVEEGQWGSLGTGLGSILLHQEKQDVWYGGQNGIESPVLDQFNTETYALTTHAQAIGEHLPSPSVIYQIIIDPKNTDRIIAAGEGGIVHTTDYGDTWQGLLTEQNYRFHFSPVFDPKDQNIIYTAGWDKGADIQPLILEMSKDDGQTWEAYTYEKQEFKGGVRSMLAVEESGKTVIYIGLYNNGVVKVTFE